MRVHIGGDHAAYDLKCTLVTFLQGKGYDVVDHGPEYFDAEDDYPVAVLRAAEAVSGDRERSASCWAGPATASRWPPTRSGDPGGAGLQRRACRAGPTHNNAQVLSIGARMNTPDEAKAMVEAFLTTKFSGDERHARRLAMVERYEQHGELPPIPAVEG